MSRIQSPKNDSPKILEPQPEPVNVAFLPIKDHEIKSQDPLIQENRADEHVNNIECSQTDHDTQDQPTLAIFHVNDKFQNKRVESTNAKNTEANINFDLNQMDANRENEEIAAEAPSGDLR